MSRKWMLIVFIPVVLLIIGYFVLQVYLRTSIHKEQKKEELAFGSSDSLEAKADTLGGKKVSAADLRPLFVQRMQQLLKKSSNGLYNLTVGDLKLDVLASSLSLENVSIRPDSAVLQSLKSSGTTPADVFSINLEQLFIDGINLDDAITSKTMDYKLIKLINPVIEIVHRKGEDKNAGQFSQNFLKEMQSLSVIKLLVQNGNIIVHDKQKGTTKKLLNVGVVMNDILLNDQTRKDKDRFSFAKQAQLNFHNFHTTTTDGLYNFKIGSASVNAAQKKLVLKDLSFASELSKEAFVKKQKLAKEKYGLSLPQISINGVDWWAALNGEEIRAENVETNGGKFSVYFDRALPPKKRMGNFPNQLLAKLPFKLDIRRMKMRNLDIAYEERNPLSGQTGTVYLDNASLDLTNISNQNKEPFLVDGTASFMHKVPIRAAFRFDMKNQQNGDFSASVHSDSPFDGHLLNSFTEPLGMMKLENGTLQKLSADMKGNELGAGGEVTVLYNDLKLALLEKDKGETKLDKKDVTSLFANLFVLKNENPKKGKTPRIEQASFKRDPTGGFVMLVWKTILVGVLKTIGAPEKLAYKKGK